MRIHEQNLVLKSHLRELEDEINSFLIHLDSDKFRGVQSDGERKDWIATGDVKNRLQEFRRIVIAGLSSK